MSKLAIVFEFPSILFVNLISLCCNIWYTVDDIGFVHAEGADRAIHDEP